MDKLPCGWPPIGAERLRGRGCQCHGSQIVGIRLSGENGRDGAGRPGREMRMKASSLPEGRCAARATYQ